MKIERRYFMLTTRGKLKYLYVMDNKVFNIGKYYAFRNHKWRTTTCSISKVCNDPDVIEISEEDAMLELI